ncbi:D-aminoacylase [Blastopirellula marina]|uniref:D-aminoacylase n=2 Tax=Blastopirellula marina TaxID=124 RepID=A0A2S8G9I4_9BACT|nr:D-aminoacylase [Blastopirellula marina]PTL45969.1 D-aminoacylase [Blastopirellula marina]
MSFPLNRFLSLVIALLAAMPSTVSLLAAEPADLLIRGGRIVDGTGAPWYEADVLVDDGKIVQIGHIDPAAAKRVIEAKGLVVAPGFIDMMGQSATPLLEDPNTGINLLTQGITTINCGEGASAAPLGEDQLETRGWTTMAEYFQLLDMKGLPVNVVQTVGHTQIRRLVLGEVDRRPNEEELERMKAYVDEAMDAGAIGLSTALIYPPAVYAQTKEIAALAAVAGNYGGRYYTHMRNEGDMLLEAIDEAIAIGDEGKVPVHIFHLKAAGRQNWGKMQLAIARIKAAREEGKQVTADIYPYINNGLGIAALIHPRHFAMGREALYQKLKTDSALREEIKQEMLTTDGWENWFRHVGHDWSKVVVGTPGKGDYAEFAGSSIAEIASKKGEDPWDTFFNLVIGGAFVMPQSMTDANLILKMQQEFISFCTDVGPVHDRGGASHPRGFGAFPRMLSRYVRDLGAISLEQAVAKASASAANKVMAYDRGRISVGLAADIIVFDYDNLAENATFAKPHEPSTGMKYVVVNGEVVLDDEKFTGARPGRVLRGPGYKKDKAAYAIATGQSFEETKAIDETVQAVMKEFTIPGAAVAVTDHGRLVYARGFGYADLATRQPVQPDSLFRLASVSKPITAVAIMQLIEQGKLSMDDKVFEILKYEPILEGKAKFDKRLNDITIRHLLQHRGGWDRDKSFDAMFRSVDFANLAQMPPPADCDAIIRVMLGKPLDFDPGERYAYSNLGYCILGRVIEKLTGESYADYVQNHVLHPLGAGGMRIGATHLPGRAAGEVRYYDPGFSRSVFAKNLGQQVPNAYGAWYLESMDSHGAWISSAIDLARFGTAFDQPDKCPILSADSIELMYTPAPNEANLAAQHYVSGWSVTTDENGMKSVGHGGSLPGTNTSLTRRDDGKNIVILLNARTSGNTSRLINIMNDRVKEAVDHIEKWPDTDLFPSAN